MTRIFYCIQLRGRLPLGMVIGMGAGGTWDVRNEGERGSGLRNDPRSSIYVIAG